MAIEIAPEPKAWYKSKTMQWALMKILGGVLLAMQQQSWEPLVISAMAVIDMVLRLVTDTPIKAEL